MKKVAEFLYFSVDVLEKDRSIFIKLIQECRQIIEP